MVPVGRSFLGLLHGARAWVFVVLFGFWIFGANAADLDSAFAGTNDYGDVGLLETPTARVRADGAFGAGVSFARPYTDIHFFLQFLPWLETTFRYRRDAEVAYGPVTFSGDQHESDKSFDAKIQILTESEFRPAVAIGFQDFVGNGDFASQYLVAGYHLNSFDFSAGIGWGRLGTGGGLPNPFRVLGSHFSQQRGSGSAQGGSFDFNSVFIGRHVSPFGGVRWNSPIPGLVVEAEYDPNNYTQEPGVGHAIDLRQRLHINAGVSYTVVPGVTVGAGLERGNIFMARLDLETNFQRFIGPLKNKDPPLPTAPSSEVESQARPDSDSIGAAGTDRTATSGTYLAQPANPASDAGWAMLFNRLSADLSGQGLNLLALQFAAPYSEATLWIANGRYRLSTESVGRTARAAFNDLPTSVEQVVIVQQIFGAETFRVVLDRREFLEGTKLSANPSELGSRVVVLPPERPMPSSAIRAPSLFPHFSWDVGPSVRQYIDSPNGFWFGQLWLRSEANLELSNHFSITGVGGINVWNNFYNLNQTSNSTLPHVRSDVVQYLKQGKNNLVELEGDYIWSPYSGWWARGSAGIFESMYAGVAAEVLYRPFDCPWAIGIDVNRVRQRSYNQLLDFRPYQTTEAFATLYYRLPFYNLLAQLTVGRYLAKDKGGTIMISRQFRSGVIAGAFATKTNVSSARFGEGSFDKGLFISVPFDFFFGESSKDGASFAYRPLTRDGGQRAADGRALYDYTGQSDPRSLRDSITGTLQ